MIQSTPSNPYVFLGGCPRSGTTLLQRMLDHHPQLAMANDAHFIPRVMEMYAPQSLAAARRGEAVPLDRQLVNGTWDYHRFYRMGLEHSQVMQAAREANTYQEFVGNLFTTLASRNGKPFAGEKTPDYVRHLPLLMGLFPHAKFVHIVRDGRDTALSLLNWATPDKGPGRLAFWDRDPLATAALWWRKFVLCHAEGSHYADRYFLLRYEDLIERPSQSLCHLCDFLELPFDEGMADFHHGKAHHTTGGSAKKKWLPATKGLRDWRTQMPAQDQELFALLAADALRWFDYPLVPGKPAAEVRQRAAAALDWWHAEGSKRSNSTKPAATDNGPPSQTLRHGHADRQLVTRERRLPHLAALLEPRRLQRQIQQRASHFDLDPDLELRANYVRYKPGTNCLVGYLDAAGNPWGHAVTYGRDASDKLQKRLQIAQRHAVPETFSHVDHQRGIVVFRFPHDPALPQLAAVAAGTFFADPKTLAKAPAFANGTPDWRILSYKPQRRCVVQVNQDGQPFAVLRLYRPENFVSTRETAKILAQSPWYAAERLGAFVRYHAVAMKWVPGRALDTFADGPDLLRHARAAGELLCQVHARSRSKLRVITLDDLIRQCMQSVELAGQLVPHLSDRIERVSQQVYTQLTRVVPRITLCHGDLHARQFVIQSAGIQLLDWDAACNGPSGIDLATFAGHQWLGALRGEVGAYRPEQTIAEFCDGYRAGIQRRPGPAVPANFEAYLALSLLRLLPVPFRLRWACWDEKIERMLDVVEQHMAARPAAGARHPLLLARHAHVGSSSLAGAPLEACVFQQAGDEAQVREHVLPLVQRRLPAATYWRCEPPKWIHHKPGRRAIVQYTFHGTRRNGASNTHLVLGKVNFKRLELTSYNTQLCLQELASKSADSTGFRVAAPLGVIPHWNMWLQQHLPGLRADQLIRPGSSLELSARSGEALARLHQFNLRPTGRHCFDCELAILTECLQRVKHVSARRVRQLLRNCARLLGGISETPLTGIHRDFYPAQIIDDGSIGIIDFDLFTWGPAAIDVGNFIAHLKETALREFGAPTALADHESSFVQAYLSHQPAVTPEAIEVLTVVSLARHVEISQRIPSRANWTEHILSYCEALVDRLSPLQVP